MNTDQENMWRTLKDEPGIMKFRCKIGWHRWSVYAEDTSCGTSGMFKGSQYYTRVFFKKQCAYCNIPKWKAFLKPRGD